jgi:hypothetical protein
MVTDVLFSFNLVAILKKILFPFPLMPAQRLFINLLFSVGAAKCLQHHFLKNSLSLKHHDNVLYQCGTLSAPP